MGQIRFILYKVSQLLPKKYRRPFILISSFLGLIVFFQIMLKLTGSPMLLSMHGLFVDMWMVLKREGVDGQVIVLACVLLTFCGYRYYSKLQNLISFGYVIVLILSLLPLLLKI